jgi:hypothetical protein
LRKIQPHFNVLKKLASLHGIDDASFMEHCFEPAQIQFMAIHSETSTPTKTEKADQSDVDEDNLFDIVAFLTLAEQVTVAYLKLKPEDGSVMLRKLQEFPEITLGELKQVLNANQTKDRPSAEALMVASKQAAGAMDPALMPLQPVPDPNESTAPNTPEHVQFANTGETFKTIQALDKTSVTPPAITQSSVLQARLDKAKREFLVCMRDLVSAAKLYGDFYESPESLHGFFVEFPKQPLKDYDNAEDRIVAWWLIAELSGQQDDVDAYLLPETSDWKRSFLNDKNDHAFRVKHELGERASTITLAWLSDSRRLIVQTVVRCLMQHQTVLMLSDQYAAELRKEAAVKEANPSNSRV